MFLEDQPKILHQPIFGSPRKHCWRNTVAYFKQIVLALQLPPYHSNTTLFQLLCFIFMLCQSLWLDLHLVIIYTPSKVKRHPKFNEIVFLMKTCITIIKKLNIHFKESSF